MTEDETFERLKRLPFDDVLTIVREWDKVWTTEDILSGDYSILLETQLRKYGWTYSDFKREYVKTYY